jgi:small-conductance mechanosensitive channel
VGEHEALVIDALKAWMARADTDRLVTTLLIVLVILVASRLARTAARRHIADPDLRYRLRKAIAFLATVLSILVVAASFSQRLAGFTVVFGVTGAAVALALQGLIASVAGWVAVLFGGFYGPGDRIQLGGIKGDVIGIGVLRTTLMEVGQWVDGDLYNGRIVRVANSFVFKEPVVNYSADLPFLWDEIKVPVKYGSNRALAREILTKIVDDVTRETVESGRRTWAELVRKYRIEDARTEPMVQLVANDNWIEYTVRYVVDFRRRRITRDQLFSRILDEFDATGGTVAFASETFQLVGAPPITVQLDAGSSGVHRS